MFGNEMFGDETSVNHNIIENLHDSGNLRTNWGFISDIFVYWTNLERHFQDMSWYR